MPSKLLGKISEDLLLPKERLDYLIRSAPHRYKTYKVLKRSGSGKRTIAQPAKEVKRIQYWVIKNIFPLFPVHKSAMAYVKGKNIRNNSEPHANNPYMLKLDFEDFFPSIKGEDFLHYAKDNKNLKLDESEQDKLMKILFWCPKGRSSLQLSIGAPSSPYFSNAIMYEFDNKIDKFCSKEGIAYTRYADDMTFSMKVKSLRGKIHKEVLKVLRELPYPKLRINNKKTVFGSKAHRRMVTGLILSNDGLVSLGRERKRLIRAKIHHYIIGDLDKDERKKLSGMIAFIRDIEPDYIKRLEKKYKKNVIKSI